MAGLKEMSWTTTVVLGLTGATAGVASGLLGIGGGTVVTPLLAIATPLSQVGVSVPSGPLIQTRDVLGPCLLWYRHLQCARCMHCPQS